jgi:hypothetical protein
LEGREGEDAADYAGVLGEEEGADAAEGDEVYRSEGAEAVAHFGYYLLSSPR